MTAPLEPTGLSEAERQTKRAIGSARLMVQNGWQNAPILQALLDEVARLSDQEVPEGHTRIDGKLYEVVHEERAWMGAEIHYTLSLVPIPSTPEEASG